MSERAISNAQAWWENIKEMVQACDHSKWRQCGLCDTPETCKDNAMCDLGEVGEPEEDAQQRFRECALSVQVRDGWRDPGGEIVGNPAEEYEVLLSTGGPALRIYGSIGRYGEPEDAMLQWEDWGTLWTDFCPDDFDCDVLLTFARQFYFGD